MNPWKEKALTDEVGDPEAIRSHEVALVHMEYMGTDEYTRPCIVADCEGTMFYKATIGVLKCTTCGELAHTNGDPI